MQPLMQLSHALLVVAADAGQRKAPCSSTVVTAERPELQYRVQPQPNGLALGNLPGVEQVELDFPDDVGDAGLTGLASGEVAGFLGFPGASPVGAVADEESGHEDFQQERGDGEFWLVRGKKPRRIPSRRPGRAGS